MRIKMSTSVKGNASLRAQIMLERMMPIVGEIHAAVCGCFLVDSSDSQPVYEVTENVTMCLTAAVFVGHI